MKRALMENRHELKKLYPKRRLPRPDADGTIRIDDYTCVEVSETHLHECEVFACPRGHALNCYCSIGFEFSIQDLPEIQKICKRLAVLLDRGSNNGIYVEGTV